MKSVTIEKIENGFIVMSRFKGRSYYKTIEEALLKAKEILETSDITY